MNRFDINLRDYVVKIDELIVLIEDISKINWNIETAEQFCKGKGVDIGQRFIYFQEEIKKLNFFNYKELLTKIRKSKNHFETIEAMSDKEFSAYNPSYQGHIKSVIKNIAREIDLFFEGIKGQKQSGSYMQGIIKGVTRLNIELRPDINELFEHFKYGNKNYVIFGKNGAGKTSLLKHISSSFFTNAIVVPAKRSVKSHEGNYTATYDNYSLNQMLEDNQSLLYLVKELNARSLESYEAGASKTDVLTTKFYEMFSSLGLEREIVADRESLYLYGDQISRYPINAASDGERSIAYLILATLLAPQNSFLFIDEPENHLNGALMRKLFDKLEFERPDIRFIYLTHVIDFVESRKNVELVYLEKSKCYGEWKFKKIEDYANISLDVILSVEGTKNDIIFCEGNRSSIDCRILECLFPEYEIKPVESCEQVKLHVRGINGLETLFRRKAFGVIDNDYMSEKEILSLNKNKIFPIGYNEWENLLIRSEILEYINNCHLQKEISLIKKEVVKLIKTKSKDAILSDFITKRYSKMLYTVKLFYNENLYKQIDDINLKNKTSLIDEVDKLSKKIDESEDYDELVSIVPAKMLLNVVAAQIGLSTDEDYVKLIIKYLMKDKEFNNSVKKMLNITFD